MTTIRQFPILATLLTGACLIPVAPASAAIYYHASLDTSSLVGNAAGPFYLDFQFNDGVGTGDGNNSVSLSNFTFGGGSASGSPTIMGDVTGDLSTGFTIVDTAAFNRITEGFTAGSFLTFDFTATTNLDAGDTPDQFGFAILDSGLVNIPTTDFNSQMLTLTVDSGTPAVNTFPVDTGNPLTPAGITAFEPTVIESVPEPGTAAFLGLSLVGTCGMARRRRAAAMASI